MIKCERSMRVNANVSNEIRLDANFHSQGSLRLIPYMPLYLIDLMH